MPSLSHYDKGKKGMENVRYLRDVAHAVDAQQKLFAPIHAYNRKRSRYDRYFPNTYITEGNHDSNRGRFGKALETSPELEGVVTSAHLRYADFWRSVTPFKDKLELEGISFTHYFASGVMGRPVGGENIAASILKKTMKSGVQGHTHILDKAVRTRGDGVKCFALCAGCFVHESFLEDWNADTAGMWWNGVIVLENVEDGMYQSYTEVSQRTLKEMYGV
jgi:hypothetical protein